VVDVAAVILAHAGIQNLDPGSESGVTVAFQQIGQISCQSEYLPKIVDPVSLRGAKRRSNLGFGYAGDCFALLAMTICRLSQESDYQVPAPFAKS
jgi:hypothetical protein